MTTPAIPAEVAAVLETAWRAYCASPTHRDCGRSKVDAAVLAALKARDDRIESALTKAEAVAGVAGWEIKAYGVTQVFVKREDVAMERLAKYVETDPSATYTPVYYASPAVPVESPASVPDGWSIRLDGSEVRVTAPNGMPGGMTLTAKERSLSGRILYALALAIATNQEGAAP